jgi:hypothetical protein
MSRSDTLLLNFNARFTRRQGMTLFNAVSSAPRISREDLSLWNLVSSWRFIINQIVLPMLLISLYREEAKIALLAGIV